MRTLTKTLTNGALAILSSLLLCSVVQAGPTRDCVLEGTVQKSAPDEDVYVAFHSARPAEEGATCKFRKNEKLQLKQPASSEIKAAPDGSRVKYRYTEDPDKGATWKLQKISS